MKSTILLQTNVFVKTEVTSTVKQSPWKRNSLNLTGVDILQKKGDFVRCILGVLQGRISGLRGKIRKYKDFKKKVNKGTNCVMFGKVIWYLHLTYGNLLQKSCKYHSF